ncbi:hypothetical protein [Moorena sp. SIO3H5]|uniref:hypothetical protein n=1 Tax=Moorena sp. SIO3H5 TaxID=2607834 RepID=UPI0013BCE46C|nr:hypothetical protein [Moorena sp. SIO3H5]NEO74385.1 hypothetical protein [Moorena sp. SIO3H5]
MKRIFGFLLALLATFTFAVPIAHAAEGTLLSKEGVLFEIPAYTAEEVVGFEYKDLIGNDFCVQYFAANPPRVGMTEPIKIPCPLGIEPIPEYNVKYEEAIDIFHEINCGDAFESIELSWPETPPFREPIWKLRSNFGLDVIIGANSGFMSCEF